MRLKFLSTQFSVFIQNVCIHLGNHVDLRMACIVLRCFQIAMIEFELVRRTGMTQRVKDHIWELFFLLELGKPLLNKTILTGTAIRKRHDQIEVLILAAKKFFHGV